MLTTVLVVLAVAFAFSMGAHYTGACMGMPYALGTVTARQALLIMAPLSIVGAAVASHRVAHTVGFELIDRPLRVPAEVIVLGVAFALTSAFNRLRVPTSTIQILVFTVGGVALGVGSTVRWGTISVLILLWVLAPVIACGLGFGLTRLLDRVIRTPRVPRSLPLVLVAVGAGASFSMGANDVANATGALVGTHTVGSLSARLLVLQG